MPLCAMATQCAAAKPCASRGPARSRDPAFSAHEGLTLIAADGVDFSGREPLTIIWRRGARERLVCGTQGLPLVAAEYNIDCAYRWHDRRSEAERNERHAGQEVIPLLQAKLNFGCSSTSSLRNKEKKKGGHDGNRMRVPCWRVDVRCVAVSLVATSTLVSLACSLPRERVSLLDVLPSEALRRSAPEHTHSPALEHMLERLRLGLPVTVTTIGMSTTFDYAGCYGELGCADMAGMHASKRRVGWGTALMRWINQTWPNPGHQLHNRATGASSPGLATACLASHLQPGSDALIVDFNIATLSEWSFEQQEYLARTVASMERPPLLIVLGLLDWCSASKQTRRRCDAIASHNGSVGGGVTSRDPAGEAALTLARHYGHIFIDVFHALRPLVGDLSASPDTFASVRAWTIDGVHPIEGQHGRAYGIPDYSEAIAAMIAYALRIADAERRVRPEPSPMSSRMPKPLKLKAESPRTLACFGWLHRSLPPPRVLRNNTGPSHRAGWFVSEVTLHGTVRRKPGLVSVDRGASIDLEVSPHGAERFALRSRPREHMCLGVTFLRSYEHMAAARLECIPSTGCSCKVTQLEALDMARHHSIFHAVEMTVMFSPVREHAAPTPAEQGSILGRCAIRLTNLGVAGLNAGRASALEGNVTSLRGRTPGKFRVAGLYLAEPWVLTGNDQLRGPHVAPQRSTADWKNQTLAVQSNHEPSCMLEARRQSVDDYGSLYEARHQSYFLADERPRGASTPSSLRFGP
jgi:hypothetical protein